MGLQIFIFNFILSFSLVSYSQTKESLQEYFQENKLLTSELGLFYQSHDFEPFFIQNGQWTPTGESLESIYKQIEENGLISENYGLKQWKTFKENPVFLNQESELLLGKSILSALIHHITGRIPPKSVAKDIEFERNKFSDYQALTLNLLNHPKDLFSELGPKSEPFLQLKEMLIYLKNLEASSNWPLITPFPETLKLNSENEIVLQIKHKLSLFGYHFSYFNKRFDPDLEFAVKDIYANKLLNSEKVIKPDSYFWQYINVPLSTRIVEIQLQMEKLRWLPRELENRYAFVNIANQTIKVFDKNLQDHDPILQFKTINGQVTRKTPSMKDKIVSVTLNPTWTVPLSVFFKDKLRILQKDLSYLNRGNFKVIDVNSDEEIDPYSIDWQEVTRENVYFQLVQMPSYSNALGVVKFSMTNRFSIYLHDTGDRHLFAKNYRFLSSGCVRLEKPIDFAEYLLRATSWTKDKIMNFIAKPGESNKPTLSMGLKSPLPVYLIQLTVEKKDHVIKFYDDYYRQNLALFKSLKSQGFF
jgi:murein L,D-transpeptidase YcbB/YkuD